MPAFPKTINRLWCPETPYRRSCRSYQHCAVVHQSFCPFDIWTVFGLLALGTSPVHKTSLVTFEPCRQLGPLILGLARHLPPLPVAIHREMQLMQSPRQTRQSERTKSQCRKLKPHIVRQESPVSHHRAIV